MVILFDDERRSFGAVFQGGLVARNPAAEVGDRLVVREERSGVSRRLVARAHCWPLGLFQFSVRAVDRRPGFVSTAGPSGRFSREASPRQAVVSVDLARSPSGCVRMANRFRPATDSYLVDPASNICLFQRLSHACLRISELIQ
jgi:hypothetical protein